MPTVREARYVLLGDRVYKSLTRRKPIRTDRLVALSVYLETPVTATPTPSVTNYHENESV